MDQFDTAIIGGSIAGSYLAHRLGAHALTAALVEPADRPGRKACGEGISASGRALLVAAGLWNRELEADAHPFYGYELHCNSGGILRLGDRGGAPEGFGVSRSVLDGALRAAACSVPAVREFRERAHAVRRAAGGWKIDLGGRTIHARALAIASGRGAAPLQTAPERASRRRRYGFCTRCGGSWSRESSGFVAIAHLSSAELLVTPLGGSRINVSMLVTSRTGSRFRSRELLERGLAFAEQLGFEVRSWDGLVGVPDVSSSPPAAGPLGIYRIGDAIEQFDPIGGMGMTHALLSAHLAADAIVAALSGSRDTAAAWAGYERKRERAARILRALTGASALVNTRRSASALSAARVAPRAAMAALHVLHRSLVRPSKQGFREHAA